MTLDALADSGLGKKEAERGEEHVHARAAVLDVPPADRGHGPLPRAPVPPQAARSPRPTSPPSAPATTTARRPRPSRSPTRSSRPRCRPARYRNISGNQALALRPRRRRPAVGPAAVPRRLPDHPGLGHPPRAVQAQGASACATFQAEDEIAGIGAAIGAAFGGALGVTTTSGPGISLKSEAIGLAVMTELPLVVVDVQRGGPSTGLPTKTEQSDLLQAMFGRNGEAPVPVIAPRSPGDCFDAAHRGGAHRDHLPDAGDPAVRRLPGQRRRAVGRSRTSTRCPTSPARSTSRPRRTGGRRREAASSCPTCATRRRSPGRGRSRAPPGMQHRIGGLEKADGTGNISYDPANHDLMTRTRQAKIDGIAARSCRRPRSTTRTATRAVAVIGWGSTYGPIGAACRRIRRGRAARWRRSTCGTSTRCRPTSATSCAATTGWSARR